MEVSTIILVVVGCVIAFIVILPVIMDILVWIARRLPDVQDVHSAPEPAGYGESAVRDESEDLSYWEDEELHALRSCVFDFQMFDYGGRSSFNDALYEFSMIYSEYAWFPSLVAAMNQELHTFGNLDLFDYSSFIRSWRENKADSDREDEGDLTDEYQDDEYYDCADFLDDF